MAQYADVSESYPGGLDDNPFGSRSPRGAGGMDRNLMGCDLQAYLPGFRSDVVHLGIRRSLDNPDVGTIFVHRLSNVEGLTISATSAFAPKDAVKALDKARDDQKKQKWDDAQKQLDKAVSLYPKYAAAWYELGNVQLQQRNSEAARQSYAKALEADPKYVSPYQQLALLAARDQNWQELADNTDRLLRLNPIDFPQAWMYNAVANFNLKKLDVAEKSAQECIARDPAHHFPKMNLLLGMLLAEKRDYAGSTQNLRNYLQYAPNAEDAEQVRKQLAEVEKFVTPEAARQ
jgi:tetratricopeptide (TPR) repeat protein